MNIRLLTLLIVSLILMFLGMNFLGSGMTFMVFSLIIFTEAVVFTFNPNAYEANMKFFNRKSYDLLREKGQEFVKQSKTQIGALYLCSLITFSNGYMSYRNELKFGKTALFSMGEYLGLAIFCIVFGSVITLLSNKLLKSSQTAKEFRNKSIILGIAVSAVLIILILTLVILLMARAN